jgi:hypothetical protein
MGNFMVCHDGGLDMETLVSPGVRVTVRDGDGHPLVWIYADLDPLLRAGNWKSPDDLSIVALEIFKWFDTGWHVWRGKWRAS